MLKWVGQHILDKTLKSEAMNFLQTLFQDKIFSNKRDKKMRPSLKKIHNFAPMFKARRVTS